MMNYMKWYNTSHDPQQQNLSHKTIAEKYFKKLKTLENSLVLKILSKFHFTKAVNKKANSWNGWF